MKSNATCPTAGPQGDDRIIYDFASTDTDIDPWDAAAEK